MNGFLKVKEVIVITSLFLIWKSFLIIFLFVAFLFIPHYSYDLLGGGYFEYNKFFTVFPWANFDGEHYISIAVYGYKNLEHAFFPIYPILISLFLKILPNTLYFASLSGLIISNVSFFMALIFLYKLLRLDYSFNNSLGIIVLLLLFPTSFFFQSVYSESLFLLEVVASFYFARKGNFFLASILASLASATRVFGILLFPALVIEGILQRKKLKDLFWILISPIGLLGHMIYLYKTTFDPFAFYNLQLIVGEQHQQGIVTFPQVVFRYLKIVLNLNPLIPIFQTIVLELLTGILFFLLPVIGYFKKIRLSYLVFSFFGFLLPTIQGSFSSTPRYVLVLFPSFIVLYLLIDKVPLSVRVILTVISIFLLGLETTLFLRGYWIA